MTLILIAACSTRIWCVHHWAVHQVQGKQWSSVVVGCLIRPWPCLGPTRQLIIGKWRQQRTAARTTTPSIGVVIIRRRVVGRTPIDLLAGGEWRALWLWFNHALKSCLDCHSCSRGLMNQSSSCACSCNCAAAAFAGCRLPSDEPRPVFSFSLLTRHIVANFKRVVQLLHLIQLSKCCHLSNANSVLFLISIAYIRLG